MLCASLSTKERSDLVFSPFFSGLPLQLSHGAFTTGKYTTRVHQCIVTLVALVALRQPSTHIMVAHYDARSTISQTPAEQASSWVPVVLSVLS